MNKIEQTTLNIEDINEHCSLIVRLQLLIGEKDYDDMLERFISTFLEDWDYEPESR